MAHRDRLADLPRRTGLSQSDEDEEELAAPWSLNAAGKFPLPGSARRPDHREPTQRGLASAVHFEVALALAGAAPMTESGKIGNRTRREFTLIGMHDRASADQQIRQICVHGARCLLGLSAVQIGGYSRARADQRQSRNLTGFLTAAAPDRPARSEWLLGGPRMCGIQIIQ
jgi:hypothetical protein